LTNDILSQYKEQIEEVKDLRNRRENLKKQIEKIEQEGSVIDSVKGGSGGIQRYVIEGFPLPMYSKKKTALLRNIVQLETAEKELLELTVKTEEYIQSIQNSRIRRIIRLKYIDNLSWVQVASKVGGTADSVRMELNRFLNS